MVSCDACASNVPSSERGRRVITSHSCGPVRLRSIRVCTRRVTISISTGLPTICQPQFVKFLPHLHDRLTTNPAGIIARAMTQHSHQDTQQSVTNIAQGLAMPLPLRPQ